MVCRYDYWCAARIRIQFYVPDIAIISVFVITLSLLAIRTIFSKETAIIQQSTEDEMIKGIGLSAIGGFIAGMTGIGGGSIMAPLIGQLKSVKAHQIAPYTNAMMFIGGLGSLYGYLQKTQLITLVGKSVMSIFRL